jgi:hypothetical protein
VVRGHIAFRSSNSVGALIANFRSSLNTLPAYPLFYASMVASRQLIAKLVAERIVTPYS